MYNWKKRLLAAVLAGCMTVGLMAPALATVGGEDTASTAVDPGFSVDPVYPVEPTDPVEPVEPTPPVETEIPDGEIPLDPGFNVPDYANMSAEELYEVVKDLSDEDRAVVYSLLTEEQIAALEEYEKAMELPEVDMEAAQALLDEVIELLSNAQTMDEVYNYLCALTEADWAMLESVCTSEDYLSLRQLMEDYGKPPVVIEGVMPPTKGTANFTNPASLVDNQSSLPQARAMAMRLASGAETSAPLSTEDDLILTKELKDANTLRLEAYAKGEVTINPDVTVPLDIVMVMDQSGSMADPFDELITGINYVKNNNKVGGWGYLELLGTVTRENLYYCPGGDTSKAIKAYFEASGLFNGWWKTYYFDENGERVYLENTNGFGTYWGSCVWPPNDLYIGTVDTIERSKLDALQSAAQSFADSVAKNAADNNVDHRIAVVGFASGDKWGNQSFKYGNTEIFVGAEQVKYTDCASAYGRAFQNMNTSEGAQNVATSIQALSADGGTLTNLGLELANGIFNANPTENTGDTERKRVVIVFTDGQPGWSGFDHDIADSAISEALTSKATYGATVYTIGVFDGADPVHGTGNTNNFMHYTSSNYPNAQSMDNPGGGDRPVDEYDTSYYLSAGNETALNEIFEKIAGEITGGTTVKLGTEAVVKDVISDYFELPEGTDPSQISVYTADYQGGGTWGADTPFKGANVQVNGKTVSVSNFDFSGNYVSEDPHPGTDADRGKKLIIEIPIQVREGFVGGNDVPTNTESSGIYETADSTEAVETFEVPTMNVPINSELFSAKDANVYYGNSAPSASELITWNGKAFNELEDWQTKFVTIDGSSVSNVDMENGGEYTATIVVAPTSDGTTATIGEKNIRQEKTATANVNVFKLYVTYQDTTVTQGETSDYADNLVDQVWKHGDATDENVAMMGSRPTLSFAYDPKDGQVTGTGDINVKVTVTKDGTPYGGVVFVWQSGNGCAGCTDPNPDAQFRIHVFVPEFTFTLAKKLANGETADGEQTFMFNITDGTLNMTVALTISDGGNYASKQITLPSGTYTVTEDSDWSWKYEKNNQSFEVTKDGDTAEFTNTRNDKNWLGGSHSVENDFAPVKNSSSDQTIDTLDALVPPLPTGEKKQENEDDQKKTEPDPGEDPDLDGMTQEGGVDHV